MTARQRAYRDLVALGARVDGPVAVWRRPGRVITATVDDTGWIAWRRDDLYFGESEEHADVCGLLDEVTR